MPTWTGLPNEKSRKPPQGPRGLRSSTISLLISLTDFRLQYRTISTDMIRPLTWVLLNLGSILLVCVKILVSSFKRSGRLAQPCRYLLLFYHDGDLLSKTHASYAGCTHSKLLSPPLPLWCKWHTGTVIWHVSCKCILRTVDPITAAMLTTHSKKVNSWMLAWLGPNCKWGVICPHWFPYQFLHGGSCLPCDAFLSFILS